jgi:hypothetical protein
MLNELDPLGNQVNHPPDSISQAVTQIMNPEFVRRQFAIAGEFAPLRA